jgi:tetratricopeptide (TPR) repeat protein
MKKMPGNHDFDLVFDLLGRIKVAPVAAEENTQTALKDVFDGNSSLAEGDGEKALEAYKDAGKAGLLPVYAHQDCAMAYLVKGEASKAREEMAQIDYGLLGPYVRVQQDALLTLCAILEGKDYKAEIATLRKSIEECTDFDFQHSPLRFLEMGLMNKMPGNHDFDVIFDLIRIRRK